MKQTTLSLLCVIAMASHGIAQQMQVLQVQAGAIQMQGGAVLRLPGAGNNASPVAPPGAGVSGTDASQGIGTLRWTNGESMIGDIVEATGSTATWKSPLFDQPMVLGWDVIHRIDWPATSPAASDSFIFSMRDGSAIYGDLLGITGSSVFISGSRYGNVELRRSEVLSIRRTKGDSLITVGPMGDAGWQHISGVGDGGTGEAPPGKKDAVPEVVAGRGGTLELPYWNRAAKLPMDLSVPVDVEFRVHSSARPNFRLSLEGAAGTGLRVETWDDALVVALPNESDFQLIRKMDDSEHDIAIRFCWDSTTRHCMVFDLAGNLITEWQAPQDDTSSKPGLALVNKGSDLALDYMRIRKWDGKPPAKIDANLPRVELADGRALTGGVTSGTGGFIKLSGSAQEPGGAIVLKDVEAIVLSQDSVAEVQSQATLSYGDGTCLNGRITGIKDGKVTLDASIASQPLTASMDGLRLLYVNASPNGPPAQTLTNMDVLNIQKMSFHGRLVNAGGASPGWLPVGGVAPVAPSGTIPYEIVRSFPEDAQTSEAPALFYTRMGDVLPGSLRAVDRTGVELDTDISKTTKLPAAELDAVQFGAAGSRMGVHGFTGPTWRVLKGDDKTVIRDDKSLDMQPGTSIENVAAMQGGEIEFGMNIGGSLSAIRMRMFCAGADSAKAINWLFVNNGSEIECGSDGMNGQFGSEAIEATAPGGALKVRLVIAEKSVDLYLNGIRVQRIPASPASRPGAGLIIEPAAVWGNSTHEVKITDFYVSSPRGSTWLPAVADDVKAQALTIPRFRREDPPSHALIAANGDILRGEVKAATTENFGFRSGMDELVVPRDRVKAIVWLGKPVEGAAPPAPENTSAKVLDQQLAMRINFGGATLRTYTSWLQNQIPGLKITTPNDAGNATRSLMMGGEPISSVLDKICGAFGMTYRLDDKGVVVIERESGRSGESGADALVEKVYWLKPGSLPGDKPADKVLAAKEIPFPKGATAAWQADAGQLDIINTMANQALVVKELALDFGGVIGSPTHWLALASGARLSLVVDNFGKETITGWHPLYGECAIPAADVASIRTYPLEPSATMKAVEDWHTYYAPEPVLPEAGGDSTASIGKPAADFKVALLDGGQFNLASRKGKVVVLDFWATWCGPCVRSLPDLIQAMSGFPADRVAFVALDQDEAAATVKQFLETRGWKLTVGLDAGQHVGQQYGVDAIPHTVIVGPDGNVAWVKTGYTPDGEADVVKEVNQLLAAPATAGEGKAQ